jgi:hypothetical protein
MTKTLDEIVKESIKEVKPYSDKKGVSISYYDGTVRFPGYSKDSSIEIRNMVMDSINKKCIEEGIPERVKVDDH